MLPASVQSAPYPDQVVAVDPNGTGEPVSISISHISLQERAHSNVGASGEVDVGNLRWKVGETLSCCEKFGDM
ncbi:hypothetical protein Pmar_PMAR012829 [Perkinsus marinus ATCC 50983]|uniref:Uncharacterized protein n=1 Tax=Perkinsus marinus (strain ATCC 50983 / TXsc) TaxID=423536 RepID=C5L5I6_PERM5|nr:hypothetical protein Pmar_PMAR012829 [Perkinsus marinus ATCC 50983]EER08011.1 hypothetical protein Pmar_PMAR012829 [Perkinsus marinus ATCC 50983]|eukprot:XP_002776195.1 hypothetical protein Pmar_PMAR012829 [Perkinsus marinus ATCC 50983]